MNIPDLNKTFSTLGANASHQVAQAYNSYLFLFKALGLLLSIFFIASSIFFVIEAGWVAGHVNRIRDTFIKSALPKRRAIKSWRKITDYFRTGDEQNLKLAIIEADNVLDEALKAAGFAGQTLADRLKKVTSEDLPNIDDLWEAHKLRNKIVHEASFGLSIGLAERALEIYQKAFQDMGLLE
jgi:hypothetical protein